MLTCYLQKETVGTLVLRGNTHFRVFFLLNLSLNRDNDEIIFFSDMMKDNIPKSIDLYKDKKKIALSVSESKANVNRFVITQKVI